MIGRATVIAMVQLLPSVCANGQHAEWRAAAEQAQPPAACVEVVLQVGASDLNAFGYDMGSGAWYRFTDDRAWGFVPGLGSFAGRSGSERLWAGPGPTTDAYIERMALPFVMMADVLKRSERVTSSQQPDGGWLLSVQIDGGESYAIRLKADGRVAAVGSPSSPDPLTYPAGGPAGYPIGVLDGLPVPVTIKQAGARPAGIPERPALTLPLIEAQINALRRAQSELRESAAAKRSGQRLRLAAGEATPDGTGSVRYSSGRRYGPALVIGGVVVLALGAMAWWRSRGG